MPAVEQVRRMYLSHPEWEHDIRSGKMFGVLVYDFNQLEKGSGYLAAFSGTLGGKTVQHGFVPPVFDLQSDGSYFLKEEKEISDINHWITHIEQLSNGVICGEDGKRIAELRHERKVRSIALQNWLFDQYIFYNVHGEGRRLRELFPTSGIPSGTGDCCAPKLLQEAFRLGLRPLAIVEWNSANDCFYPPCMERCYPLLKHMLQGLDPEPDPRMLQAVAIARKLDTVYEDEDILLVNKPSGLLSVPGREFYPNVKEITGCLPVHRLDQDTSGLLLLAKKSSSQTALQQQFQRHEVRKVYEAILERPVETCKIGEQGDICLPLRPDFDNRPYQIVDMEHGKDAQTHYRILGNTSDGHAMVLLCPETGRTHQLRVHCSNHNGLDNPILGDRLYGSRDGAQRLMLNASEIEFMHPGTGKTMHFSCNLRLFHHISQKSCIFAS